MFRQNHERRCFSSSSTLVENAHESRLTLGHFWKRPLVGGWSSRLSPFRRILAAIGLLLCLQATSLHAQRPNDARAKPGMERIDPAEGAKRLISFRQQRLDGDYLFEFELEHKPRRARTKRYQGTMWGTWNEKGALTRVRLFAESGAEDPGPVDWIVQNGPEAKAWVRRKPDGSFQPISGTALFEPLIEGLSYSIFDLQMPFIYWPDFRYEGPVLVGATRVAQSFLMFPPEDSPSRERGIEAVRIGLDDTYNALLRIEVLGAKKKELSRFQVESFKKVGEQYIVKKITLTQYPSKDRTTFHVTDASVGLQLDPQTFILY